MLKDGGQLIEIPIDYRSKLASKYQEYMLLVRMKNTKQEIDTTRGPWLSYQTIKVSKERMWAWIHSQEGVVV